MSVDNGVLADILHNSPLYPETLEDVEHPPWVSFSESCGSCLSRISSMKDSDSSEMLEARVVPNDLEKPRGRLSSLALPEPSLHHEEPINGAINLQDTTALNEDYMSYTVSGSLQSLSSSSKTVYASPRPSSENQFQSQLNRSLLSEKAKQRRGSLYRERAPSENALDFTNLNGIKESKLSHSLHDVSSIPSNGLKNPSRRPQNTGSSLSALYSRNRSRDSGFIHSESLLSLNSGSHNYDHVESKVKRYIQNIKDADALRRKERAKPRSSLTDTKTPSLEDDFSESQNGPELVHLVHKMQRDLNEKDQILFRLKEDYYALLKKYAEAENKIDKLRFGFCDNASPTAQGTSSSIEKSQSFQSRGFRQLKETAPEIDDSSLSSSLFLSHFEAPQSPDSSIHLREDGLRNRKHMIKSRKEVIVSAPLRPISSLYCTSVRLDRVMAPLTSKSSSSQIEASSTASSRGDCSVSISAKGKKVVSDFLPEITIRETGTTDTGIDSFCPLSTEGMSTIHPPLTGEPIGHLPHEDSILKVQRWQKSLPKQAQFSPCSKSTSFSRTQITDNSFDLSQYQPDVLHFNKNAKVLSSIGIQVNASDAAELPSVNSEMSTPNVPCLNLGELSGCTEDLTGSMPSSEYDNSKSVGKLVSVPSTDVNTGSAPDMDCSFSCKNLSSNIAVSTSAKHRCEGRCKVCGCQMKLDRKQAVSTGKGSRRTSQDLSGGNSQTLKRPKPEGATKGNEKSLSQLNGLELTQLMSLVWRDQDHVVPASPEEEKSLQDAFKTLEQKMNALKASVNLQTFVSLLDMFVEKLSVKECTCDHNVPCDLGRSGLSVVHAGTCSTDHPSSSAGDSSLLQCLEEVDDYTHQVLAKTKSILKVLNEAPSKPS